MNVSIKNAFFIGFVCWSWALPAQPKSGGMPINTKQINFYQVELICPAAPLIGCGSAAKPILLELEKNPAIAEAWLSRAGTTIAIVWKENIPAKERQKMIHVVLDQQNAREINGKPRNKALKSFQTGSGWYQGAAVDRLSEEEAGIIAGRLVAKIGSLVSLPAGTATTLEKEFTTILARKLTGGGTHDPEQIHQQLLRVCQEHLPEGDIATLQKAREQGAFSHLRNP